MVKKSRTVIIKVTPNASHNKIVGWKEGVLWIRLKALPEKGKANDELVKFLSKTLGVSKAQIEILSGETSRLKRVKIEGLSLEAMQSISCS